MLICFENGDPEDNCKLLANHMKVPAGNDTFIRHFLASVASPFWEYISGTIYKNEPIV